MFECKTCSTEWNERYLLKGIEDDPLGRNVLAFDLNGIKGHVSLGNNGLILHLDGDLPHIWYNILNLVKSQESKKCERRRVSNAGNSPPYFIRPGS